MSARRLVGYGLVSLLLSLTLLRCSDDTQQPDMQVKDVGVDTLRDGTPPDKKIIPPDVNTDCVLSVAKINGKAVTKSSTLTAADDTDKTLKGLQVDVTVAGVNLPDKTKVKLSVTDVTTDRESNASKGEVEFKAVTIGHMLKQVTFAATADAAAKCKVGQLTLAVTPAPECTFVAPADGASLGAKDDKTSGNSTFDYDVTVKVFNAASGSVELTVESTKIGTVTPNSSSLAVFKDTVLPEGNTKALEAKVTVGSETRSCKATVTVDTKAPSCKVTFSTTKPPVDLTTSLGRWGFGKAQDVDSSTADIETDVSVETNPNATDVVITVDGSNPQKVTTSTGKAEFTKFKLSAGEHTLQATCTETSTTNKGSSGPVKVLVDATPPDDVSATTLSCKVDDLRKGKVCVSWTAVGDNASGSGMSVYQVRYRTDKAVDASNWDDSATTKAVTDLKAYPKGAVQKTCVSDLTLGSSYNLGIKAEDKVKNESAKPAACSSLLLDFGKFERVGISSAKAWGSVMATGDYNCDGLTDLAVGNPTEGTSNQGAVYIYLGSKSGYLKTPEKVISGTVSGGMFGAGLAKLASFDGDSQGCRDLAVLASHGTTEKAKIYIYLGRKDFFDRDDVSTGKGADLVYSLATPKSTERLGPALTSAGDFDFDGLTDLAVSYSDTGATTPTAEVWVIYGDKTHKKMTTGMSPVAASLPGALGARITGGVPSEGFGATLAGGSSLDGDQFSDLLVPAAAKGTGTVYLVRGAKRGTTLPDTVDVTSSARAKPIAGGSSNGAFGTSVAVVGDMDKNGYNEFAVGDPTVASKTGEVYVFDLKGKVPKVASDAVVTVSNDVTGAVGDEFGYALADAGPLQLKSGVDLNGDGYADLVAATKNQGTTSEGAVYIFKGSATLGKLSTSKAFYVCNKGGSKSYGANVVLARDIDGAGYVDLVVADPQHNSGVGRFFVFY